jgi:hypothetical protein
MNPQLIIDDALGIDPEFKQQTTADVEKHKTEFVNSIEHKNWLGQTYTEIFITEITKEKERLSDWLLANADTQTETTIRSAITQIGTYKKVIAYARQRTSISPS